MPSWSVLRVRSVLRLPSTMCFSRSSACRLCRRLILTRQAVAQVVAFAVPNEEALPILDDASFFHTVQAVLVKRLPAGQEGEGDADRCGAERLRYRFDLETCSHRKQ